MLSLKRDRACAFRSGIVAALPVARFPPVPVLSQQPAQVTAFKAHVLSWQTAPVKGGHKFRRACALGGKCQTCQMPQQTRDAARINPLVPQATQGQAVVALGQALSLCIQKQGHMGIGRRTIAQEFEKSNLARGRGQNVPPAHHLRDAHERVVHGYSQLVGHNTVGTPQGEIAPALGKKKILRPP